MDAIGEVYLGYKAKISVKNAKHITSSKAAAFVLNNCWDKETLNLRESFKILLLNRSNRAVNVYGVSDGGITGTVTDIRLIIQAALLSNACTIILAHNHPSGNKNPSEADVRVTTKIKKAAELFDINVFDHIILVDGDYLSFVDEGLL